MTLVPSPGKLREHAEEIATKHPLLTSELWLICEHYKCTTFVWESKLAQAINKTEALQRLIDGYHGRERLTVCHIALDGTRSDVTRDFAELWAQRMRKDGWSPEEVAGIRFIGKFFDEADVARM